MQNAKMIEEREKIKEMRREKMMEMEESKRAAQAAEPEEKRAPKE